MKKMKFREVVPQAEFTAVELEARSTLWRQGDLSWKLKGKQDIFIYFLTAETDFARKPILSAIRISSRRKSIEF